VPGAAIILDNEMLELLAHIAPEPARPDLQSGWRGLIDFGEVGTESDADFWSSVSGRIPLGDSLMYGCELRLPADDEPHRAKLFLWALDSPRMVMRAGAEFMLWDGRTLRARGRLLEDMD
jgi:hypothetical protein